jgi:hypothetical protein
MFTLLKESEKISCVFWAEFNPIQKQRGENAKSNIN